VKRGGRVALRLFIAHGLAYPVAIAWAFATVPVFVVAVAAEVGLTLDDAAVAHRVLLRVAWPAVASFVLVHAAGAVWAFDRDAVRGRRSFVLATCALAGVAVVLGAVSWTWLMAQ